MTKIGVDVVLFIRDIKGKQKTPKNSFLRTLPKEKPISLLSKSQ
jgi:hypothetical protein